MTKAIIITGGNEGDVEGALAAARRLVGERAGKVVALSSVRRSAPWGDTDGGDFLNQVLVVETALPPEELLDVTQEMERELGRERGGHGAALGSAGATGARERAGAACRQWQALKTSFAPRPFERTRWPSVWRRFAWFPARTSARSATDMDGTNVGTRQSAAEQGMRTSKASCRPPLAAADCAVSQEPQRHYASRPIDIDILFYGDEIINTQRLTVPHPLIARREFVLEPLAEIVPEFRHPVTGKTVAGMLAELRSGPDGGGR